MGHDAVEGVRRGCAGLPKLPRPDATYRVDNAAENYQSDSRLRRSQTPTAVGFGRNSENLECESPAIITVRGSSVFPLTQTSAGRTNKQEPAHANTLECHIRPLRIHFSTPSKAQNPGSIHPRHQNGAFKNPIHKGMALIVSSRYAFLTPRRNARPPSRSG